ncbi:MAG TPA: 1-deoxy-D-xylulose-5-phosphate reductoisomerase [Rhodocyclaceae bacterium]|nr:1-deoxy-D-xylulose-5-phosphate reductoisomerase [Rhodocyclaceae bacterium]
MKTVRNVTVLGATGSIGMSTLDVIGRHPDRYRVFALTARTQVDRLLSQCLLFAPRFAVVGDASAARGLSDALKARGCRTEVLHGVQALVEVARDPEVDAVMAAIVGAAGLLPTIAAAQAGKQVLLANKEALVLSGALFMDAVRTGGAQLLPIDSEHNAVFQCLPAGYGGSLDRAGVRRILLTASGGPFRLAPLESLAAVTPDQACAHPNWVMGRKISVDSATMMNKGLELIEARWLFDAPPDRIDVVIHPQSVIHSMVEYVDGSVIAQLGNPDMRTPIAHALAFPERIDGGVASLDLFEISKLTFERPDLQRFPCLGLAYAALRQGGGAAAVMNAANEEAVAAFLAGRLAYTRIAEVISATLERADGLSVESIEAVIETDQRARAIAHTQIEARRHS